MKLWLALFAVLPLLAVSSGSSATAGTASPPRNGLIAAGGENGIHVIDPQTGTAALIPKTEEMSDPAWSPDGGLLAVSGWDGDTPGLYTMKADGSDSKLVVENAVYPSWSPDGKWLAAVRSDYYSEEPTSTLVIVKADGSEERELAVDGASTYIGQPQWSPDGKRIAFVDEDGQIRLVTPDGETVARHRGDREAGNLSWSPDSSMLAFDSYEGAEETWRQIIVVLDLATGKKTVLRGRQDGAGSPAWSPDGKQIAFLSLSARAPVVTTGCGGEHYASHLWVMAVDGTNSDRVAKGSYYGASAWARSLEPASSTEAESARP